MTTPSSADARTHASAELCRVYAFFCLFIVAACDDVACPTGTTEISGHCKPTAGAGGVPEGENASMLPGQSVSNQATSGVGGDSNSTQPGGMAGGGAITNGAAGSSTNNPPMAGAISSSMTQAAGAGAGDANMSGSSIGANAGAGGMSTPSSGSSGPCIPSMELCDNADNDCDGRVDEEVTRVCGSNMGSCKPGTLACHMGVWDDDITRCEGAVGPSEEACDPAMEDENCNGLRNEGCSCADGMTMSCGSSNAPCRQGTVTCTNGKWPSECAGEVKGSPEKCDGIDNDCNATVDDGGNALCSGGQQCAGNQGCVECLANSDCSQRAPSTCKQWTCNQASHRCQQENAAQGTPCNGSNVCSSGSCVRCISKGDCPDGQNCVSNACVKEPSCGDRIIDPGENCDDGNKSDTDDCTSNCKLNVCGDRIWNKDGNNREDCDLGALSNLSDNRAWDKWSCTTSCKRQYAYTPCTSNSECGSGVCDQNRGGVCFPYCSGATGSSCQPIVGKSGICIASTPPGCMVGCSQSNSDCPPRSVCQQSPSPDLSGNMVWLCVPN